MCIARVCASACRCSCDCTELRALSMCACMCVRVCVNARVCGVLCVLTATCARHRQHERPAALLHGGSERSGDAHGGLAPAGRRGHAVAGHAAGRDWKRREPAAQLHHDQVCPHRRRVWCGAHRLLCCRSRPHCVLCLCLNVCVFVCRGQARALQPARVRSGARGVEVESPRARLERPAAGYVHCRCVPRVCVLFVQIMCVCVPIMPRIVCVCVCVWVCVCVCVCVSFSVSCVCVLCLCLCLCLCICLFLCVCTCSQRRALAVWQVAASP